MSTDRDTQCCCPRNGIFCLGKCVLPVHGPKHGIICALHAYLQHHEGTLAELLQIVEHLIGQAVWTGRYGQTFYIGDRQCFFIFLSKHVERSISTRERLEIGQVFHLLILPSKKLFPTYQLLCDSESGLPIGGMERAVDTISTPSPAPCTITIGTSEAAVNWQFLHFIGEIPCQEIGILAI